MCNDFKYSICIQCYNQHLDNFYTSPINEKNLKFDVPVIIFQYFCKIKKQVLYFYFYLEKTFFVCIIIFLFLPQFQKNVSKLLNPRVLWSVNNMRLLLFVVNFWTPSFVDFKETIF